MSGVPLISIPGGGVCEPLLRYFCYAYLTRLFRKKSSMNPDAYSLREWFCFLANLGIDWTHGDNVLMRTYRRSLYAAVERGEIEEARVELKMTHIFNFYLAIPYAMPFVGRGIETPVFVGKPGDRTARIASKSRGKGQHLKWEASDKVDKPDTKRPTPDLDGCRKVLKRLRSKSLLEEDGTWERLLRVCEGERDWLMARCALEAGLRRSEIANLSLLKIAKALAHWRIVDMPVKSPATRRNNPLSGAANDERLRQHIRDEIAALRARGYRTLSVSVQKKGNGERAVEFPLELIVDLLEIGVWKVRKRLFDHWTSRGLKDLDDDALFLSSTGNGARILEGSVGDIVNDAFKAEGVRGSVHRLRAYYLTTMAWLLWNQYLAIGGYRNDISVSNQVLNRLADLAGHKNPSTTERFYLDQALLLHQSEQNQPRLDAASDTMNTLIRVAPNLGEKDLRLLGRVIAAVSASDNPLFFAMLEGVVEKYAKAPPQPPAASKPNLRVV
jgi:integrase